MSAHLMGTAAGVYEALVPDRRPYLERARDSALLTIPSLMPPEGHNKDNRLYQPYQSVGARGVNNLSSKLLITQFPANTPFFRIAPDPSIKEQLDEDETFKTEVEKKLAVYERTILFEIETSGDRSILFEAIKHLIVTGNILLYISAEGLKSFQMDKYVVRRDAMGNAIEIVVKECFDPETLPAEVRVLLATVPHEDHGQHTAAKTADKTIEVYTHIRRRANQWVVHQELSGGLRVPGSDGQFALDKTPWLPLRMIRIDGENWGRGYVEEYLGDLKSLEALTRAIVQGSAAAAKVLFLIKPNGTTKMSVVAKAPSGAIREGNAEDVTVLQLNKFADFRTAREMIESIKTDLGFAFLLNTAAQRQAERVTAEEIRYVAEQLEAALGGIYSILTQEFQLPYVNRRIALLVRQGKLKKLPREFVRIKIVTGLDALGRGADRQRLVMYLASLQQLLGPEVSAAMVNPQEVAQRLAMADGVDLDGLIKSQEQMAQEMQQRQMAETAMASATAAAPVAAKAMVEQNTQERLPVQ